MPQIIPEFRFRNRIAIASLYDKLLDGQIWVISSDEFVDKPTAKKLRNRIVVYARGKGFRLKTAVRGEKVIVKRIKN